MKVGVVFPQTEFPSDAAAIKDFAQAVEDLGFNHLLAYEHVVGVNPDREGNWSGPYSYRDPFFEPIALFSYLSAVTQELEFITGFVILPQRQTTLFAKQAATLDILCKGRLRIGVGLGWNKPEYISLDKDFHNRGERFEEQIHVLRELWTKPLVTFEGNWHRLPDVGLNPLPVQNPIPLWFGGHADPVLRRVARLADGWLPNYRTPDAAAKALTTLQGYAEAEGRTLQDIGIEPRIHMKDGDEEEWQKLSQAWKDAGATHLTLITMGAGFRSAKQHLRLLEKFTKIAPVNT